MPCLTGCLWRWKMLRMVPGLWKGYKGFCHYSSLIGLVCLCLWAFILSPLFPSFFPGLAFIYFSRHSSVVPLSVGSSCVFLHFSSLGYTLSAFLANLAVTSVILLLLVYVSTWIGSKDHFFFFVFSLSFLDISWVWGRHWVNAYWMDKWIDFSPFIPLSFLFFFATFLVYYTSFLPSFSSLAFDALP